MLNFYTENTSKIEIVNKEELQTVYFPRFPHCTFSQTTARDSFNSKVDRTSELTKCEGLVHESEYIDVSLSNEYKLTHNIPVASFHFRHKQLLLTQMMYLIIIICVLITIGWTDGHKNRDDRDFDFRGLSHSDALILINTLGYYCIYLYLWIAFKEIIVHVLDARTTHIIFTKPNLEHDDEMNIEIKKKGWCSKTWYYFRYYVLINILDARILYHLFLIIWCILIIALQEISFYALLLTYVMYSSDILKDVLRSVFLPIDKILTLMGLYIGLTWGVAIVTFLFFNSTYDDVVGDSCQTLWSCYVVTFDQGYKSGAGSGAAGTLPYKEESDNTIDVDWERFIFDYIMYFIIIVLVFSILTGIIIDKFAELRGEEDEIQKDNKTSCFICGQTAQDLDKKLGHEGFNKHTNFEHNKWDYVYFLAYLRRKSKHARSKMTENEYVVYEKYKSDKNSWLPCYWDYNDQKIIE